MKTVLVPFGLTLHGHVRRIAKRGAAWRQGGQSVVEAALIFPILLTIGMVAVAGAQLLYESIALRTQAREGALAAAAYVANPANLHRSNADVLAYVQARLTAVGTPSSVQVAVSPRPVNGVCSVSGQDSGICLMTVTLSESMYPAQSFFGGIPLGYTATAAVP